MSRKKNQFHSIIEELGKIKYENISSTGRLYGKFITGNILYSLISPKNSHELNINKKEIKKNYLKSTENILDDIINSEKNYQNENFFSNDEIQKVSNELQDSIKKYKEKSLIPTIFSSIEIKKNKKFYPNERMINYLQQMKKKTPPMCYYEPNYESIDKHIPHYKLQPIKKKNNIDINHIKIKKLFTKRLLKKKLSNNLNKSSFIHAMSFEKYSSRPDIMTNKPLGDGYNQIKIYKNISIPNFKKMLPREKNVISKRIDAIKNYSPNYSSIYCDKILLPEINEDLKKKKNLLRKSLVNYNIGAEYEVITKLNDN